MDESRASCAIDISGRGLCAFEAELPPGAIGNFDHELTEEFFRALAANARLTLHVTIEAGTNAHHVIEAAFKAVRARAAGRGGDRPTEHGVPEHQGDADVSRAGAGDRRRRLRDGQPALGPEGARARRRETPRSPTITTDPARSRRDRAPGRGRVSRRRCAT